LTRADVTAETIRTIGRVKRKPTGFNDWLVERHKDQVPEDVFNILGQEEARLLESKHARLAAGILGRRFHEKAELQLHSLSPIVFGTQEELAADRLWLARKNQAEIIGELAKAEFKKELPGVLDWLETHIKARRDVLIEYAAHGRWEAEFLVVDSMKWAPKFHRAKGSLLTHQGWPDDRKTFRDVTRFHWFRRDGGSSALGDRTTPGHSTTVVP
jgi:hypothetical protein